jgi:hypothetical protein
MLDRVVLTRDLVDARGAVLAPRGFVVTLSAIEAVAARAPALPRRPLSETPLSDDLHLPLSDPPYRHLFRGGEVQAAVARALLSVRLPQLLFEELFALRGTDPARWRHALTTAAVTARLLVAAVGEAPAVPDVAAAAFLHDIGMRHLPAHLLRNGDGLDAQEVADVAGHPLVGGWFVASFLGRHAAVDAAVGHHWRNGAGYPRLPRPPSRAVHVVAVASSFSALTQARSFRSEPYDARGATDVLIGEAADGRANADTVRLLVHAMRGARGELRRVQFGRERLGHAPAVNRHTRIAA